MQPHEIRELARTAALEQARRLIVEFPDILAELNKMKTAPNPARDFVAVTAAALHAAGPRTRRMTAEGRQAIVDAQRRRWAKHHKKNGGAK